MNWPARASVASGSGTLKMLRTEHLCVDLSPSVAPPALGGRFQEYRNRR